MTLANQFLQLLPTLTDLLLHHRPCHSAVRHTRVPDVLRLLAELDVILRHSRNPLLILPGKVRNIPHGHREERPGRHGTEGKRRRSAEENATVTRDDGTGHSSDNDVDTTWKQLLARLGRGGQRGNGLGETVLDVQGARQEVVEAVLDGKGVVIEEETGLTDLGSQDICRGRRRGRRRLGLRSFFGSRDWSGFDGRFRDLGWEVIVVDGFSLDLG